MASQVPQVVDPEVSKRKFDQMIESFGRYEDTYRARGWFLITAAFPEAVVLMAAPQLEPPTLVACLKLDYTNYDAYPPSVTFVHPFNLKPLMASEVRLPLFQQVALGEDATPIAGIGLKQRLPLLQAYQPTDLPFLCLAGVLEYHMHPGHTGDPWELYRCEGRGRIEYLLEQIDKYGVRPLTGYALGLRITGYTIGEPPR